MSHQIKSLEKELGEQLFVRGKRSVSLTPSGELMLEHANKILSITDALREEIEEFRNKAQSTFTLSMVYRGLDSTFPELYRDLKKAHPEIQLRFHVEPDALALRKAIQSGKVDLGVLSEPVDDENFGAIHYGWNRLHLVSGPEHRLSGQGTVKPDQLRNERWGLFEKGDPFRDAAEKFFIASGVVPKSIFESNDGSVIRNLISSGDMIGFLYSTGVSRELRDGELVVIPVKGFDIDVETNMVWRAGPKSPKLETLIKYLIEHELSGMKLAKLRNGH